MVNKIVRIIDDYKPSIYLYGPVVLDDFKLGWSDIDILVLDSKKHFRTAGKGLVVLRQAMLAKEPNNPYYRSFEGGRLMLDAFVSGKGIRLCIGKQAVNALPIHTISIALA